MRSGKVSEAVLERSVLRPFSMAGIRHPQASFGWDAQMTELIPGQNLISASVSTSVGGSWDQTPDMVIIGVLNNLTAAGAAAQQLVINIAFPAMWQEAQLKDLVREIADCCKARGLTIAGGHTEISNAVLKPVISITGFAMLKAEGQQVGQTCLQPGMDLVMAGTAGCAGTLILAKEKEEELRQRFPLSLLEQAGSMKQELSIEKIANIARSQGSAAIHDISQGGVFGALWEMAQAAGVGLEVDLKQIPIRQETIEICELFRVNPYQLFGQGAALIGCMDGEALEEELKRQGIRAGVIGRATDGNDRILRNGEETRYLDRPAQDMLRVMEDSQQ